jgi:hypothetical protein
LGLLASQDGTPAAAIYLLVALLWFTTGIAFALAELWFDFLIRSTKANESAAEHLGRIVESQQRRRTNPEGKSHS